jgi:hypothetical protein
MKIKAQISAPFLWNDHDETTANSVGIIRNPQGRSLSPSAPPMPIWPTNLSFPAVKLKRRICGTGAGA